VRCYCGALIVGVGDSVVVTSPTPAVMDERCPIFTCARGHSLRWHPQSERWKTLEDGPGHGVWTTERLNQYSKHGAHI
jgi:hypothetical protein